MGDNGKKYFPFVFSLFMFVLIGNMVGMVPYQFTFTSHIIVTFALAAVVFIGVTILGFVNHGIKFFTFFYIPGVPFYMHPLLIPIEVISYLSRPISLSVRLLLTCWQVIHYLRSLLVLLLQCHFSLARFRLRLLLH